MKVAALDLGTNSFLCLVAEVEAGQITQIYEDQMEVVRLGQDVNRTKKLHPEALERARACLERFSKIIRQHKPERILAMATSAARDVSNASELFAIGHDLGIPIEIIPGGQEAEITFKGATSQISKDQKNRVVIDVGGGSTEYILGSDHQVKISESVNIGCVRLTEEMISDQPTSFQEMKILEQRIDEKIRKITSQIQGMSIHEVIAVAGTPSALAAIELGGFSVEKVDGHRISTQRLRDWTLRLAAMSVAEKIKDLKMEQGRADVILVGALILWRSLEALHCKELIVSTKGVRFGVALELAER